ncbi:hypothetical protein [Aquisalibacillus elongatus]|uniref:DUF4365 domain-containing protein n=1 Tax=Aquisalibacillus elongatus TaxID=485577 RepID=A0A3N5C4S6_9BACI|nr:hypothetical protein [Aquisalibacillus elongatus]RPF54432.1 hypothetical protein EDC24_1631 [Aquisalibacillus elongatus]
MEPINLEDKISSKQKGDITESRVAELITLGSRGQLTCYTPSSDDDGIDIIVNAKGEFNTLYIQVKSRFNLNKKKRFVTNIGCKTFKSHSSFYIIFMYFSPKDLEVETVWLIPSKDFEQLAYLISEGKSHKSSYRFAANPKSEIDKWAKYKVDKSQLGQQILKTCLEENDKEEIIHHCGKSYC